jgi:hypothetical protein
MPESDVPDVVLGEVHSPYPSTPSLNLTRDGIHDPSFLIPVSSRYQAGRPRDPDIPTFVPMTL